MRMTLVTSLMLVALLGGCGDDTGSGDLAHLQDLSASLDMAKATDLAGVQDLATNVDAAGMVTLKIEDYINWCNVSVNGGANSTADPQIFMFPTGTVVNLSGDTASAASFVWGYWRGTAGDTTGAHDTAKTTTVTMSGNKTVQACCPLTSSPTTPCPDPT
jgi:hypothetical protein